MNDFKNYAKALKKLKSHKLNSKKHIIYKNSKFGFGEKEIWGEFDDFCAYENWLKEQ